MTPFDWILICICVPWASLMVAQLVRVVRVLGPSLVDVKPYFFIPWAGLLFVAYRVWG
jgi:hypothetical protein